MQIHKSRAATLLIVLAAALPGCNSPEAFTHKDEDREHAEAPPGVVELSPEAMGSAEIQIEEVKDAELADSLETTGVIGPNETRLVHIRPLSRGIVKRVYVRRGDQVRKGQPLV